MLEITRQYLLQHIIGDWQSLADIKPWGMWIGEYSDVSSDFRHGFNAGQIPITTWFLDLRGLSHRSVWEYKRFEAVHIKQTWCKRMFGEPTQSFSRYVFEIGLVAFGMYENRRDAYYDVIWGGLSGNGWRVINAATPENAEWQVLWES